MNQFELVPASYLRDHFHALLKDVTEGRRLIVTRSDEMVATIAPWTGGPIVQVGQARDHIHRVLRELSSGEVDRYIVTGAALPIVISGRRNGGALY